MSGNYTGGKQAARTNKAKFGDDFYKRIGTIGGGKKGRKGFAVDNRTWWQRLLGKPTRQQLAGKKGGTISRRKPSKKE